MRRESAILLATAVWLQLAGSVVACELPVRDGPPVLSRRPVIGENALITSGFGMRHHPLLKRLLMHTGVDWAASIGTPVVAAQQGIVASVAVSAELGAIVIVNHGEGWQTLYGHLSSTQVIEGDCVAPGAIIGKVGTTGQTPGPALHFEVQRMGQPLDPLLFVAWR